MENTWIDLLFLLLVGVPGVALIAILRRALRQQRERLLRGRARFSKDFGFDWMPRRWKLGELPEMRDLRLFDGFALVPMLDPWVPARVMRRSDPELWLFDLTHGANDLGPQSLDYPIEGEDRWTVACLRRRGLDLPRFWTSWDVGRRLPQALARISSLETKPAIDVLRGPDGKPRAVHGDDPARVRALLDRDAFRAALEASAFDVQGCGDHLIVLRGGGYAGRRGLEALLRSAERLGEVLDELR